MTEEKVILWLENAAQWVWQNFDWAFYLIGCLIAIWIFIAIISDW